jgi:hypothetical protein
MFEGTLGGKTLDELIAEAKATLKKIDEAGDVDAKEKIKIGLAESKDTIVAILEQLLSENTDIDVAKAKLEQENRIAQEKIRFAEYEKSLKRTKNTLIAILVTITALFIITRK